VGTVPRRLQRAEVGDDSSHLLAVERVPDHDGLAASPRSKHMVHLLGPGLLVQHQLVLLPISCILDLLHQFVKVFFCEDHSFGHRQRPEFSGLNVHLEPIELKQLLVHLEGQ
jgi:hypothetical protein